MTERSNAPSTPEAEAAGTAVAVVSEPIELDTPIKRGDQIIGYVQIRKPSGAGELRGLNLVDVGQLHVDSLIKLLPRVTVPRLLPNEVAALSLADLLACGAEIASFLLKKRDRPVGFPDA